MIYRHAAALGPKQYPQSNLSPHFALSLPLLRHPSLCSAPVVISLSLVVFKAIFSSFSSSVSLGIWSFARFCPIEHLGSERTFKM